MLHRVIDFWHLELQALLFLEYLMVTKSEKVLIPLSSLQTKQQTSFLVRPPPVDFSLTSFQPVRQTCCHVFFFSEIVVK